MYSKILCATDFSETSLEAVRVAHGMALALQADLLLVHVVEPPSLMPSLHEVPSFNIAAYDKAWKEEAAQKLKSLVGRYVNASVPTQTRVLSGHPARILDECAREEEADLIVIATHGMTGWRHYLMGSVAQKVIQYSCLPVLVVRGAEGDKPAADTEADTAE